MEGSSLTTSLRYQALLSCFLFFFCNQLAFARLVIRRAVEMESLQFVGCSWFIGLIGLVSDSPEIKVTEKNRPCVHSCPFPVSSRPHLDAPVVHSLAVLTLALAPLWPSSAGTPTATDRRAPTPLQRECTSNRTLEITEV